jgi:hypothetical protein
MENNAYGTIRDIQLNNEVYQLQSIEFEDEKFFFVNHSDEVICMIMQDEKNEWEPDCDISSELFQQIIKEINQLYLK